MLRHPPPALQVVVDAFDPSVLVSDCATRVFDFTTVKEEELHDISIPLNLTVGAWRMAQPLLQRSAARCADTCARAVCVPQIGRAHV